MEQYDSDIEDEPREQNAGVPTNENYDPERNERIKQMMQASSQSNVMEDEQVTDFVMRMHEKNQNMVESVQRQQQQQFTISDSSSEDDEMMNRSDLDVSFTSRRKRALQQRNPDDYPPGEGFVDEMDEEDQIPSFDPKDDDAISYGRLCCVACALVIAMVATSVLILVFVVIADEGENEKHHGGFDGMVLPFAPSNLQQLCSVATLKTFQGVLDCREPCMKAACCWERGESGQQPVCWESHPLECAPYESCINLLTAGPSTDEEAAQAYPESNNVRPTSTIPVAPDGVKSCNPANINSVDEVLLCEDSCSYGSCCWKKDGKSNQCPTDPNCGGYKPCEILNSGGSASGSGQATAKPSDPNLIPPPPSDLEQTCAQESKSECQAYCNTATCCWKLATVTYTGPYGNAITESVMGSCSHESECAWWAACRDLPTAISPTSSTDTIPQATGLDSICDTSLGGECLEKCNLATCCWQIAVNSFTNGEGQQVTEAVQGSCSHREECAAYQACTKLPQAAGNDVPTTAPASVPQATDLASACATSLDGVCRETCHKATCCWKLATTTYTGPQGNTITESVMGSCSHLSECAAYEPCKQLSEATSSHTQTIPPAPAELPQYCEAALDGECRDTCHQATCCWKLATTQYTGPLGAHVTEHVRGSCSHRDECVGYEACQKLPEANTQEEEATPPPIYVPMAPANLDQVCHPAPEEMDAIEACVEYCDAALCCWKMSTTSFTNAQGSTVTESVQGSCSHQPECEAYKACSTLDNDVFSPHTPQIDTPEPTAAPVATPSPGTVAPGQPDPSTEYTEDVIFDVCYNHEQQANGPNLCQQVCDPGACCWNPGSGICDQAFDCAKYEPCTKLVSDADANNSEPSELEAACGDKGDLSECVRLCAGGTCCFTIDEAKTCNVAAPGTVCSEFSPCEIIYNGAANGNN